LQRPEARKEQATEKAKMADRNVSWSQSRVVHVLEMSQKEYMFRFGGNAQPRHERLARDKTQSMTAGRKETTVQSRLTGVILLNACSKNSMSANVL
jgi:hypothetical protein